MLEHHVKNKSEMSKALVIYSGGQDSTTCLFWAKTHFDSVTAIAFNYGQRHVSELTAAKQIADQAGVPLTIFNLDLPSSVYSYPQTQYCCPET